MGNRYIWGRYSPIDVPSGTYEEKQSESTWPYDPSDSKVNGNPHRSTWVGCTQRPTGPDANGVYALAGETFSGGSTAVKQDVYPYFVVTDSVENMRRYFYSLTPHRDTQWLVDRKQNETEYQVQLYDYAYGSTGRLYDFYRVEAVEGTMKAPGALQGNVAANSSSAYPSNGMSGAYWYQYKGADNIDPSGVSYSNNKPKGGESLGVTVTPRSNTYGGTIYYQYSYSTDGGATWTDSGSKTTSTTKYITVPKGKTQFRARVIASDSLGYTSTTYVAGANLPVINMRIYIGVSGRARKIKNLYVGINGRARKVIKGYIGDANGKARSWF